LVEAALPELEQSSTLAVLDLGTGSGAIVIALASEHPRHRYVASDRSPDAVKLAKENARRHQLEKSISFCIGKWFEPLGQTKDTFDMIVSNPPYIRAGDIGKLQPEIHGYEPRIALDGGEDGLDWIKLIVRSAPLYLRSGGSLIMEIGHDQREDIQKIISDVGGYDEIRFSKDYSGHDRIVRMRKAMASISSANNTAHALD
jgi:release factor glutamine methyltransferase